VHPSISPVISAAATQTITATPTSADEIKILLKSPFAARVAWTLSITRKLLYPSTYAFNIYFQLSIFTPPSPETKRSAVTGQDSATMQHLQSDLQLTADSKNLNISRPRTAVSIY
jgi:hypothetical protein